MAKRRRRRRRRNGKNFPTWILVAGAAVAYLFYKSQNPTDPYAKMNTAIGPSGIPFLSGRR